MSVAMILGEHRLEEATIKLPWEIEAFYGRDWK
jgi:hypothetical protein